MFGRIPTFASEKDLKNWLQTVHEKYFIELKKASDLPSSFWDTYSSFSNTAGGLIILGVEESRPRNNIIGVGNAEKIVTNLWNQLSNKNKVSFRNVENSDIVDYQLDEARIIIVSVKEAPENMKPVFINGKDDNTYIRTGDGDRKATREEINAMYRNAQPNADSLSAEQYTLDDLDPLSVIEFKSKVNLRFPKNDYDSMSNADFLKEIGACYIDRYTNQYKIRKGTLLFLGKVNSIKEMFPHYHLDFFNRQGNNPRWIDRVSDDEPYGREMNLYNFYTIVYEKLRLLQQSAFALDSEQMRIPLSNFDESLREALVNCLAHADYIQGYPSTKIEAFDGRFYFTNPGKMLVPARQFVIGGDSRPRNEIIMKLFRLLGASERQGFGGPLIFKSAQSNDYRFPEITTDLEHTELVVWTIDLADSYSDLSPVEKTTLRYIMKSVAPVSINTLKTSLKTTDYQTRKAINSLVRKDLVQKIGNGPSTGYAVVQKSMEFYTQLQAALDVLKQRLK